MVLKMIRGRVVASALVALSCLSLGSVGCGEDEKEPTPTKPDEDGGSNGDPTEDGGGNGGGTYEASFTLIPITDADASNPIVTPHKISVLDAVTGEPLNPPIETMSGAGTGKFTLKGLPEGRAISLYAQGVGPAAEATSTYDTILVNFNPKGEDPLFRISTKGLLAVAPAAAGFTVKQDRAAAAGAIYWAPSPAGSRKGTVGCAKICLNGALPTADLDVRYVPANQTLPSTLDKQSQTSRSGRFYAGNLPKGKHTLAASIDECKTTLAPPVEFSVPITRDEAKSEVKAVILQLFIDLDLATNPTPASCPAE